MNKVLIVEDEKFLVDVLSDSFKSRGWEVRVAQDGEHARETLKQALPQVVILDLMIPKVDGFEILKQIKSNPVMQAVRVIVYSGLERDEDIKKALRLGADDYFAKTQHPISELVEKAERLLIEGKPGAKPKGASPT